VASNENENDERWYVQFDSREVRLMTLEELDAAFEQGLIHGKTFVIEVGGTQWKTLAEVAGLGDDAEESPEEPESPFTSGTAQSPFQSVDAQPAAEPAPVVGGAAAAAAAAARARAEAAAAARAAGAGQDAWPPTASVAPAQPSMTQAPAAAPSMVPGPMSLAPAAPTASPSMTPGPMSMAPVVQDIGDIDLDATLRRGKRKTLAVVVVSAAAIIGGLGFAISRLDQPPTPEPAAAAPVPTATFKSSTTTSSYASTSTTNTGSTTTASDTKPADDPSSTKPSETTKSSGNLTEDMKRALLAQDKERSAKRGKRATKTKTKQRPARRAPSGPSTGLKGNGDAHDPLNSNL